MWARKEFSLQEVKGVNQNRLDFSRRHMEPSLINMPKYLDSRGNLSYIEEDTHLPFRIRRVYWIYDVPGGQHRGSHAFRKTEELIVALSGSFDVVLHDGIKEYRFHLCRSYYGVLVPKMIWRMMKNFSTNSLALVIASTDYDAADYIEDFEEFISMKQHE